MKKIVSFLLAVIICFSFSAVAFAENPGENDEPVISDNAPQEPGRPEETIWYFRVWNGVNQMRLWSLTYGVWLTDWIDIGPA